MNSEKITDQTDIVLLHSLVSLHTDNSEQKCFQYTVIKTGQPCRGEPVDLKEFKSYHKAPPPLYIT